MDTILATLPNGDAVDRERFARDLDDAADWFCALAHGIAEHETAPSLKTRRWDALLKGLDRAQAGLQGFPGGELTAAADELARIEAALPDFEPHRVPLEPVEGVPGTEAQFVTDWEPERQIRKVVENLDWLIRVAQRGHRNAESEVSAGGNRPDEAREMFLRRLARILRDVCGLDSLSTWTDRGTGETKGDLPKFLAAVVTPLDYRASRRALVDAYRRANA